MNWICKAVSLKGSFISKSQRDLPAGFIRPVAISPIYFSPSQLTSFPSNVVAFIWQRQFVCRINFAVWRNYCKSERRKKREKSREKKGEGEGETKATIIMHYAMGTSAEVELVFWGQSWHLHWGANRARRKVCCILIEWRKWLRDPEPSTETEANEVTASSISTRYRPLLALFLMPHGTSALFWLRSACLLMKYSFVIDNSAQGEIGRNAAA